LVLFRVKNTVYFPGLQLTAEGAEIQGIKNAQAYKVDLTPVAAHKR
jgi:hypothetical protein